MHQWLELKATICAVFGINYIKDLNYVKTTSLYYAGLRVVEFLLVDKMLAWCNVYKTVWTINKIHSFNS